MARIKRPFTPFAPFVAGPLKSVPPLPLPEAAKLRELALPFTETELTHIRTAMALHKASRQPQLTYDGWKVIGLALNIGEVAAKRHAKGTVTSRGPYGQTLGQFLNATGFAFLNKGVRWALRQWIDHLDEVDPWHESLLPSDRAHLNNPIDVWDRFCEDRRTPRKQQQHERPATKQRRGYPSLLEELQALQDALDESEERSSVLENTLLDLVAVVPPETLARLPDALLRRLFPKLPQTAQDVLHKRLFDGAASPGERQ